MSVTPATEADENRRTRRAVNRPAIRPPTGPSPTATPKAVFDASSATLISGYRGRIEDHATPLSQNSRMTPQRARRTSLDMVTSGEQEGRA